MEGEKNQEFFPENDGKKNCEQRATECIKNG